MTEAREVEVKRRADGRWEWERIAPRGNLPDAVVASDAGQGYENRADAVAAAQEENPGVPVYLVEDDGTRTRVEG